MDLADVRLESHLHQFYSTISGPTSRTTTPNIMRSQEPRNSVSAPFICLGEEQNV